MTLSMAEADWGIAQVEIPNEAAGADVKIELVPIDEQGLFGTVYAYEIPNVKKAFAVTPAFTKWDETTGEIASSTMIENNASSVGVQDMVLILAQFDENGAMLKVDTKPIQVELGFSEAVLLSTTAAQGAAKACLFVWSGTSLADAGETTYADMVSITK